MLNGPAIFDPNLRYQSCSGFSCDMLFQNSLLSEESDAKVINVGMSKNYQIHLVFLRREGKNDFPNFKED